MTDGAACEYSPEDQRRLSRLAGLQLTYPEVGATTSADFPVGYYPLERSLVLGSGVDVFERASTALLSWQMHRRAGFRVVADAPTAVPGSNVLMTLGRPPLGLSAPCRVIYQITDSDRRGFGYGTLPGHPEKGEEAFIVTLGIDERVGFTVRAFSRPGSRLATIGGRAGRLGQRLATQRYLLTLRSLATS